MCTEIKAIGRSNVKRKQTKKEGDAVIELSRDLSSGLFCVDEGSTNL